MSTFDIRVIGILGPGRVYKVTASTQSEAYEKAKFEFRQETGELTFFWEDETVAEEKKVSDEG